ncbi:7SK snRNA methylphosphate capping enzyme [Bufo bufo]|uniref:7SK snRNA methylphosphate capping enzyme n=1 Tax=Bufo bufo TaxID=8384 RepID=UPI001ABEC6C6|nr:7SK snRNA methylphosphate capping enzyme [Bufo bufo]XP_040271287.1 7SK snRNA methylphosphate capping enzyme [Bufo bufo]
MQVLLEMASSSETLQPAVEAGDVDSEKTFLAPLPPVPADFQNQGLKEGLEPNPPRVPRNGFQGKRRNSFNVGFKHPTPFKRRRRVNSDCDPVLPSNFLLGGNIFDPLNLNSLLDEEVSRTLNAETPKSSPLPSRNRDPVEILIPKDLSDPLSLNTGSGDVELLLSPLKSGRKRHRHRHHLSTDAPVKAPLGQEAEPLPEELRPYELNTTINCRDEVVALPSLEHEAAEGSAPPATGSGGPGSRHRKRRRTSSKSEGRQGSPEKGKNLASVVAAVKPEGSAEAPKVHCRGPQPKGKNRFQFGNYCRYYGYRNPSRSDDPRLRALRPDWFRNKAVLDIGCNVGHMTLNVALKLEPLRIVGLDIDGSLIHAARQNIRHYLSQSSRGGSGGFPAALAATRGPIAAPSIPSTGGQEEDRSATFPHNVVFVKGNYVLDRDELLTVQRPEYDIIMCLSVTKWVHLNWGDDGLKRMFKRMYRHLRPGGILILEPQPWSSYGKRKKLTEAIYRNFCNISLRPDQFTAYLMSSDVGFSSYELLATPCTSAKGFQRSIYAYHKSGIREEPPPPPSAPLQV